MSTGTSETTFPWPRRRKSSWRLAGLIFAMVFLHSAAFFLFQAATPVINPPPRTAAPVQLLTRFGPNGHLSPENESLLRWIEAEDPALVARIPNVDTPINVDVPYRASFQQMRTGALSLPPEPSTVQFPPARDALTLIMSGMPAQPTETKKIPPQGTRVTFSSNLAARLSSPPEFKPQGRSAVLVQAATFLVGVAPNGETRFVFPQRQETGSAPELEKEAAIFLSQVQFAPASSGDVAWGTATVLWGDDIVANR